MINEKRERMKMRKIINIICAIAVFCLPINFKAFALTEFKSISVDRKSMSVCIKGEGGKTIVMLPGWGTKSPIDNFSQLADALSKNYRVVIIEYFGYGKSDVTEKERSNENIINEVRTALRELNIEPPYILMPHSMSGIHATYYAREYPKEVEAIIGIDASKPARQAERWTEKSFENAKFPYGKDNMNVSVINQWNMFYENSKDLFDYKYPENLPVLSILASEQMKLIDEMIKTGETKNTLIKLNEDTISNSQIQKIEVLEGPHYLHEVQSKKICELADNFIKNIANPVASNNKSTETNLDSFFGNESGCAIFFDDDKKEYRVYNPQLIDERVAPCSTFKIALTLAGLKYGVLQDENTLIKWDGTKRFFDSWNQDLTLKDAFRYSASWYFAKVAEMIGPENLTEFVKSINYGNCDTSAGGKFWIDSPFKISPREQVDFLIRVFNENLDINPSYIDMLKKIMCSEENKINDDYILGKTGSNGNNIGWFVGKYKSTYFAIRLLAGENVSGIRAREILKSLIISGKI